MFVSLVRRRGRLTVLVPEVGDSEVETGADLSASTDCSEDDQAKFKFFYRTLAYYRHRSTSVHTNNENVSSLVSRHDVQSYDGKHCISFMTTVHHLTKRHNVLQHIRKALVAIQTIYITSTHRFISALSIKRHPLRLITGRPLVTAVGRGVLLSRHMHSTTVSNGGIRFLKPFQSPTDPWT